MISDDDLMAVVNADDYKPNREKPYQVRRRLPSGMVTKSKRLTRPGVDALYQLWCRWSPDDEVWVETLRGSGDFK